MRLTREAGVFSRSGSSCLSCGGFILLFVLVLDHQCWAPCGHLQPLAAWLGSRLLTPCALLSCFGHPGGLFALSLPAHGSPERAVSTRSSAVILQPRQSGVNQAAPPGWCGATSACGTAPFHLPLRLPWGWSPPLCDVNATGRVYPSSGR